MKYDIEVENIRCGGCASTISKKLLENAAIQSVDVQIEDQIVVVETTDEAAKQSAIDILLSLSYPEKGSVEGIAALKGKAKSVVSCAVGKMS
ncbi:MAG: heavy-metal-associated domain-containing protein [Thiotrichaceae bacterium]